MAENTTAVAPRERQTPARYDRRSSTDPFTMLERFAEDVNNVFDDFGMGRSWFGPRLGRNTSTSQWRAAADMWAPAIEVSHRDNELLVRADLPGMKRDDVCVDVTDDNITISGKREQEQETERGGIYRSERSYGSFCRTIPLPEGAMADQAKATFKDGVLEVRMPAPDQTTRGRRLEIQEPAESKK